MKTTKSNVKRGIALTVGGVFVGAVCGLLGGGGGMLTVPLLQKVGKLETKTAHATAILVMLPLSLASAITYTLAGAATWRYGLVGGLSVGLGAVLGAGLLARLPKAVVSIFFYGLMLAAGVRTIVG